MDGGLEEECHELTKGFGFFLATGFQIMCQACALTAVMASVRDTLVGIQARGSNMAVDMRCASSDMSSIAGRWRWLAERAEKALAQGFMPNRVVKAKAWMQRLADACWAEAFRMEATARHYRVPSEPANACLLQVRPSGCPVDDFVGRQIIRGRESLKICAGAGCMCEGDVKRNHLKGHTEAGGREA